MAQSAGVAQVSSLNGEAFARDAAGKLRRLKVGDSIREGESVVAADGSQVQLTLNDGREISVRPGEVAKLDAEVAATVKPDATDSAVINPGHGFEKVANALTTGNSLDALLDKEAPAAGGVVVGNEGHSFVEFVRVVETVVASSAPFELAGAAERVYAGEGTPAVVLNAAPATPAAPQSYEDNVGSVQND